MLQVTVRILQKSYFIWFTQGKEQLFIQVVLWHIYLHSSRDNTITRSVWIMLYQKKKEEYG